MAITFIPLKALLILSSNQVPGFFPEFLARLTPVVLALVIFLFSAFLALLLWAARALSRRLDLASKRGKQDPGPILERTRQFDEQSFTNLLVSAICLVLIWTISPWFVLGLALALPFFVAVALAIPFDNPKLIGFASRVDRFSSRLSEWLLKSAFSVVVVLAFVTLALAPAGTGSSAILASAILGRKALVCFSQEIPLLSASLSAYALSRSGPNRWRNRPHSPIGRRLRRPIDFLRTADGSRIMKDLVGQYGMNVDTVQLTGSVWANEINLVGRDSEGAQTIIQFHGVQERTTVESAISFRKNPISSPLFPCSESVVVVAGGFPAICIRIERPEHELDLTRRVTHEDAARFQVEAELSLLLTDSHAEHPGRGTSVLLETLAADLAFLIQLNSSHKELCVELQSLLPSLAAALESVPSGLAPLRCLTNDDVRFDREGALKLLGGPQWSPCQLGERWFGNEALVEEIGRRRGYVGSLDVSLIQRVEVHAALRTLSRETRRVGTESLHSTLENTLIRIQTSGLVA